METLIEKFRQQAQTDDNRRKPMVLKKLLQRSTVRLSLLFWVIAVAGLCNLKTPPVFPMKLCGSWFFGRTQKKKSADGLPFCISRGLSSTVRRGFCLIV